MAQLIPPRINEKAPPGERLLFDRFKNDPETEGWVVLHSLGVAKHPKRSEGELDFVVLVPDEGILCLEIKSGRVSREGGLWKYGTGPFATTSLVGPFRQASEAMHALRTHLSNADAGYGGLLFFSAAIFTLVDFDETSPEWHPWQVLDRSKISRSPISKCCLNIFQRARNHLKNVPSAKWFDSKKSRPSISQIKKIANILRGDFDCIEDPRFGIESAENNILKFTEEQYSALDVLQENPRVVFKGPAGSGKTFLAVEAVRRSVGEGKRVLFVCYNRLLGQWLKNDINLLMGDRAKLVTVGTLHKIMMNLSGLKAPEQGDQLFWKQTLSRLVVDRGLDGVIDVPQFDFIVLDEAQDLINEEYLDVLDLLLVGGLTGGRWAFFGDYERQAIYSGNNQGDIDLLKILGERSSSFFKFPLRANCRNVAPVAIGIETICGLNPGYSKILNESDDHEAFKVYFYKDLKHQQEILENILEKLNPFYHGDEIVILSAIDQFSTANSLHSANISKYRLTPLRDIGVLTDSIRFTTIHSFKGLEAPVIIITDVSKISDEQAISLLYVGMSRARTKLILIIDEKSRNEYREQVQNGLFERKGRGNIRWQH